MPVTARKACSRLNRFYCDSWVRQFYFNNKCINSRAQSAQKSLNISCSPTAPNPWSCYDNRPLFAEITRGVWVFNDVIYLVGMGKNELNKCESCPPLFGSCNFEHRGTLLNVQTLLLKLTAASTLMPIRLRRTESAFVSLICDHWGV